MPINFIIIFILILGGSMEYYKCSVCSYVYKPEKGDWIHDIEKGTKFEDLPEDWKCPSCNQPKLAFTKA